MGAFLCDITGVMGFCHRIMNRYLKPWHLFDGVIGLVQWDNEALSKTMAPIYWCRQALAMR